MPPIRRPLPHEPGFPLTLVYRDTKSPQAELPDHQHDWYELVYVYSGEGAFLIDQSLYTMSSGDLFLIPGDTIHHARPDAQQPVTSTALFLQASLLPTTVGETEALPLACYAYARQHKQYRLPLTQQEQTAVTSLLETIHDELAQRETGYRQAIRLAVMQLLLTVYRAQRRLRADAAPLPAVAGPYWMRASLLHIDAEPADDLGLTRLARLAAVSTAHYSRVFKQWTGMTLSAYVAAKRMQRATELLLHSDLAVQTIAEQCGMDSMPYFHRMFRRHTGMTPLAYRKQAKAAAPTTGE